MTVARRGVVYLVGAGPGDPGLITVRGRELLDSCDAIVHDALANPALFVTPAKAGAHVDALPALYDVGKRGGATDSARQDNINALLIELARAGKSVVRLKGGDSFVFGRGSEEAEALVTAGIAFEVVPGVTAGIAGPAYAGIPVTHRGLATSVTFVTGHEDPEKGAPTVDWSALARAGGTIVLYMGVKTLPRTVAALTAGGLDPNTPAAAIEWGTYPKQRTVVATLDSLVEAVKDAGLGAPVITVIGAVVSLRETIGWFERKPLHGKRILVTRARDGATGAGNSLASMLAEQGAEVIEMPATRIEREEPANFDRAIAGFASYTWLVFTSRNAVSALWDAMHAHGLDARAFAGKRVAAVGPATAGSLRGIGIAADVMPDRFVAEAVLDAMLATGTVAGARVLYVCAAGSRDVLPAGLRAAGANVEELIAYRSVADPESMAPMREQILNSHIDFVTFTSASAVKAFMDAVGEAAARETRAVSIGPVTTAALRDAGVGHIIEASEATMEALVSSIVAALGG